MDQKRFILLFVGGVFSLILVKATTFIVRGIEQAVVVRAGRVIQVIQDEPGLYFKWPLVDQVEKFDKRLITQEIGPSRVPTAHNEFIHVSSVAHWRIKNPEDFLESVRTEENGAHLLGQMLNMAIRDEISRYTAGEAVAGDGTLQPCNGPAPGEAAEGSCVEDRGPTLDELRRQAGGYGIDLLGLEVLRIAPNARGEVESKMVAERHNAAERLRTEGRTISTQTLGTADLDAQRIINEAQRRADEVRAKADEAVYATYTKAYETAPGFYDFFKTLESYKTAINGNTTLMVKANSQFYGRLEAEE